MVSRRLLLLLPLAALPALPAQEPPPRPKAAAVPAVLYTPSSATGPALADVLTLPPELRGEARYLSLYYAPDAALPTLYRAAAKVLNSLSRNAALVPPVVVRGSHGRLLRFLVGDYAPTPKDRDRWCRAWRRLADLGSGRDPYPDPHFHREVEVGHYEDGYGNRTADDAPGSHWVKVRTRQAQASWLPVKETLALVAEADCESPILRLDWFAYYALLEPRYHEFLGLDDRKESYEALAGVAEVADDDETKELGSIVLRSEVATHPRGLFRRASAKRHGRGYFWESRDFDRAVKANDVLQDPSRVVARAYETIGSLPNGLQFYGVFNAQGNRLDRAGVEFAHDSRNGFESVEVEVRNCFCCHTEGLIPVRDAVRGYSTRDVRLGLRQLEKRDRRAARFIADRYFSAGVEGLVAGDQQTYTAAVRACNGLTGAASGLALRRLLLAFERDRTLEDLAVETGYPVVTVRGVLERSHPTPADPHPIGFGLDHSVMGVLTGERRTRYDQFEATGFSQLMERLAALPVDAPPPARPAPAPRKRDTRTAKGEE
jgi:hypothetical protein